MLLSLDEMGYALEHRRPIFAPPSDNHLFAQKLDRARWAHARALWIAAAQIALVRDTAIPVEGHRAERASLYAHPASNTIVGMHGDNAAIAIADDRIHGANLGARGTGALDAGERDEATRLASIDYRNTRHGGLHRALVLERAEHLADSAAGALRRVYVQLHPTNLQ
jgi:hypothetical protein